MKWFLDILNKPYPILLNRWKIVVFISCFIFLFLFIFQPFGINQIENHKTIILVGYGAVTGLMLIVCEFLLPKLFSSWFSEENWTIKRHIIWMIIILSSIGCGNFIYSTIVFNISFSTKAFIIFQLLTVSVGIIPVSIIPIIKYNKLLKLNLKLALEATNKLSNSPTPSTETKDLKIVAENKKDTIHINENKLLFIQSLGNYIQLISIDNNNIKKTTLRCSLKNTETQLKGCKNMYRCHRAYIVNLNHIKSISGNAQGLKIKLRDYNEGQIPVSRNLSKELKTIIEDSNSSQL